MRSILTQFGHAVRQARTDAGMTQKALAEEVGVDRVYLLQIASGKRNPTLSVVIRLCRYLGMTPSKLLEGLH